MRLPDLPTALARIYPPSVQGGGDARNAAVRHHNLYFSNTLLLRIRDSLEDGSFPQFYEENRERLDRRV